MPKSKKILNNHYVHPYNTRSQSAISDKSYIVQKGQNRKKTSEGPSYNTRSRLRTIATGQYRLPTNYGPRIGFDNWEVVAGHLDLLDLINLADVCVDARAAAQLIFKRRYSSYCFRLLLSNDSFDKNRAKIQIHSINDKMAWINNYTICLKMLRNFGSFISQLEIDPPIRIKPVKLQQVIKYVNEYCTNTKNDLVLRKYLPILVKEPLENVNEVTVHTAKYSVAEFNKLFAKIQYLKIYSDEGRIYMRHHFPRLENLFLITYKYDQPDGVKIADIRKAIKLNPQIKSIYIERIVHNRIENMFEMVKKGADIDLYLDWNVDWKKFRRFLLDILRPVEFEKMYLSYHDDIGDITLFVNKFKNLKCLIVESFEKELLKLIETLPMLQDFQICFREEDQDIDEDINDLADAISSYVVAQKLSALSFHFEEKYVLDIFQAGVNRYIDRKVWSININQNGPKTFNQSMVLNRIQLP